MHSFFSSDSEAPTEEMVKRAVELGLPAICLTDHYDMDYSTGEFSIHRHMRQKSGNCRKNTATKSISDSAWNWDCSST